MCTLSSILAVRDEADPHIGTRLKLCRNAAIKHYGKEMFECRASTAGEIALSCVQCTWQSSTPPYEVSGRFRGCYCCQAHIEKIRIRICMVWNHNTNRSLRGEGYIFNRSQPSPRSWSRLQRPKRSTGMCTLLNSQGQTSYQDINRGILFAQL